jgi:hypothetical protein
MPAAVIGASIGKIGTAVAQQSLRGVLSFCNARQMTAPQAYIQFNPEAYSPDGDVHDEGTADFLRGLMADFRDHVEHVLTVFGDRCPNRGVRRCGREVRSHPQDLSLVGSAPVQEHDERRRRNV